MEQAKSSSDYDLEHTPQRKRSRAESDVDISNSIFDTARSSLASSLGSSLSHSLLMSSKSKQQIAKSGSPMNRRRSLLEDGRDSINEPVPSPTRFANNMKDAVILDSNEDDMPPLTIPDFFLDNMKLFENRKALAYRMEKEWDSLSYLNYYHEVMAAAKSFVEIGLQPLESVGISCFNTPMHFICALGAIFAGGVYVAIINKDSDLRITSHIIKQSKVNIMVVDSYVQLTRIQQSMPQWPTLKAVVMLERGIPRTGKEQHKKRHPILHSPLKKKSKVYYVDDFFSQAMFTSDGVLSKRLLGLAPNRCCAVFYPKIEGNPLANGVMFSHDNLTYAARSMGQALVTNVFTQKRQESKEYFKIVSYLPLNTPFAFILEILIPMTQGGLVCFANPDALKGSLVYTLREVQPHLFCGTSRVWSFLQRSVMARSQKLGAVRKQLLLWSGRKVLFNYYQDVKKSNNTRMKQSCHGPVERYMTKKVKRHLGLDKCFWFLSFDGPLKLETLEYFISLDIYILETINSHVLAGAHSIGTFESYRLKSVGSELPNYETVFSEKNSGQLYARGRHVCMGVLHPVSLDVLFDSENYIYTGVAAYRGKCGSLYIHNQSKEILTLLNGCPVPYATVEKMMKANLPIVSHCMLVGHKENFSAILLTLKTEVDPVTLKFTNQLVKSVQRWVKQRENADIYTVDEIAKRKCPTVYGAIEAAIANVNKNLKHRAARIRRWRVLNQDFSIMEGEVDPFTLKLRREVILAKYNKVIEGIYDSPKTSPVLSRKDR